jgi:membrane AbrB-like protein
VAVAADLGADERTVVVTQYLRVALVVLTMPLVATFAFGVEASRSAEPVPESAASTSWWAGLLFMAVAIVVGTGAAMLLRLPTPATLGPLILSAAVELGGWAGDISVPLAVMPFAFVIIGWQAGLSFDRPSIKALGRIFVWALGLMLAVIAACAVLGALLSLWTGVGLLQGYLATTPGGLAAVLAVASASDSDVTFVAASQVIRLVLMLLSAPAVVWMTARWLRRRADASPTVDDLASSASDNHDRAAAGHDHQRLVTRRSCRALRRCALRHRWRRWCGRRRPRHRSKRCAIPRCPMRS